MSTSSALYKTLASSLATSVAALIAYLATSAGLMSYAAGWQIALFSGAIAGLCARSLIEAIAAGSVTLIVAAALYPPAALGGRSASVVELLILAATCAAAASVVSALRHLTRLDRKRTSAVIALTLLLVVLVNLWHTSWVTTHPTVGGFGLAQTLRSIPQPKAYTGDGLMYLRVHHLMSQGVGYYDAFRDGWAGKSDTVSPTPWAVFGYRLPTIFWLWSLLPDTGASLIPAFLAFASLAALAAFAITAQLGLIRLAPLSAAAVAAVYLVYATSMLITFVDPWATAVALCGIAALMRARTTGSRAWLWVSVALFVLAALMREILVYLPLLAAAAALAFPKERRPKDALPWLAALGAFALGYALHAVAVGGAITPRSVTGTWLNGSVAHLKAAYDLAGQLVNGKPWAAYLLALLGVCGAVGLVRTLDRQTGAFMIAATVVPSLGLLVLGNPGVSNVSGELLGYWGVLGIPINLALAPAAILLMRPKRSGNDKRA